MLQDMVKEESRSSGPAIRPEETLERVYHFRGTRWQRWPGQDGAWQGTLTCQASRVA